MLNDTWLWIVCVIAVLVLLFLMVYNLLAFDELKHDHKNPIDVCDSINPYVRPEYIGHGVMTLLFLLTGNWLCFLINAGLVAYHIYRYWHRPSMQKPGIYDPTEMFDHNNMKKHTIESGLKLAFYMLTFFFYLYRMMYSLLSSEEHYRTE